MQCTFKVSIVGLGKVGSTTAFSLLHGGMVTDLVLVAHDLVKAEGELLDLQQSLPFLQHSNITLTDDYQEIAGSQLTIVTAGVGQQPGEDRLSLLRRNVELFSDIMPKIAKANPNGLVLIVTNPVDVLTFHTYQIADFKYGQVLGSGTLLDTARFRSELSRLFHVNPRSIHTYVLGEHGDTSFPVLSSATIGGQLISTLPEYESTEVQAAFERAKHAAYKIIERKGATYYAIAAAITNITKAIYADAKTVLPVSIPLFTYQGITDIQASLSVPCIVGERGVERVMSMAFSDTERQAFSHSAEVLRQAYSSIS